MKTPARVVLQHVWLDTRLVLSVAAIGAVLTAAVAAILAAGLDWLLAGVVSGCAAGAVAYRLGWRP